MKEKSINENDDVPSTERGLKKGKKTKKNNNNKIKKTPLLSMNIQKEINDSNNTNIKENLFDIKNLINQNENSFNENYVKNNNINNEENNE